MPNWDKEWIGVDLDGTLAYYDGWKEPDHIGLPVPKMVERVRKWLVAGKDVRIFTARVSPTCGAEASISYRAILNWLRVHVGQELAITHEKDPAMLELWDDRTIQIIANTGERADGKE